MKYRAFLLLLALAGVAASGQDLPGQTSLRPNHAAQPPTTLRTGLWTLWRDREITVAPAPHASATVQLCPACASKALTQPIPIHAANNMLALSPSSNPKSITFAGSILLSAHGESLTLQHPLRITARNGTLVLAVTLPVESYVERVVASESSPTDSPESLKALAIVVRSFALHQPHGHADYDLCDSTHCQLLRWTNAPSQQAAAHAATLSTAGETLWFHGRRAQAWFHQNCGGRTASPSEAWPSTTQGREAAAQAMPWLISRIDPYCTVNGPRQWSASLSLADLTASLSTAGLVAPGWTTLTVAHRGESGRAETLLIGNTEVTAEDFRLAVGRDLGWNKILSTWFEVARQDSSPGSAFLFHGRGSGHGVGLCQAGAAAMSALGKASSEILAQYFPGAIPADEATGQPWQSFRAQQAVLQTLHSTDAAYLPQLAQALAEAQSRSGLQSVSPLALRTYPSTPAFRNATLAPGWFAAFTEGNFIATQPLRTLTARNLLLPVLRHEFLHALVEAHAAPGTPLWLREGLVETWSQVESQAQPQIQSQAQSERIPTGATPPTPQTASLKLEQIDRALAHASTEAQSQAAHRAAALYAQRLLAHYGRAQVLAWLHSGMPTGILEDMH